MKVLWTIGNWKRTGPVDPSLDLARAVQACGHDVTVWVGGKAEGERSAASDAVRRRELRLDTPPVRLSKHWNPLRDLPGLGRLRRTVAEGGFDRVVCTLRGDHHLRLEGG